LSAEVVLALIPSRLCSYQFHNRLDNLTLHSTRMVTFKLVAVKIGARDLLSCISMPVIRNRYSYSFYCCHSSVFVIIRSVFIGCSIILFHFHLSFVLIVVQKRKEQF
jgi:hypothetical protein